MITPEPVERSVCFGSDGFGFDGDDGVGFSLIGRGVGSRVCVGKPK